MTRIPNPVALKAVADPSGAPPKRKMTPSQQVSMVITSLQTLPRELATHLHFLEVCDEMQKLSRKTKLPDVLSTTIAQAFNKPITEIDMFLKPVGRRVEFDGLVPTKGWIHDYVDWTRHTEPPTVFHFFVAATVIGATLGRGVSFDKGAYSVYPNLAVMIVAPTGRCRKTSACNVGTGLYQKGGGNLLADKTTPEALVDSLKTQPNACGLIYAPELAVFLGKQKYQEGMIPLLTALLDCPKEWTSKTVGTGDRTLTNVALSALLCSTLDWIKTSIPQESFGGGFMSRFLFVVQESTSRSFPLPPPLDPEVKKKLTAALNKLKLRKGVFTLSPTAEAWYRRWYDERPSLQGDKQYAGYFERKPDHILRLAMVMWLAFHIDDPKIPLVLEEIDLVHALKVLTWLEEYLPATFDEMTQSATGEDQARILRTLQLAGGTMEHASLLRKLSKKMNGEQFKRYISTLKEAKLIEWDAASKTYILTSDGWS